MSDAPTTGDTRPSFALASAYGVLAAVVLVAYAGVLWDGVRHDDHLHRAKLRTMGWSWHDLIESTTFEFPGRQMHFWWQTEPVQWRYPRPVTMAILKTELLISHGDPRWMHAFSLAWHWFNGVLVLHLATWCLGSRSWGLLAAVLFALCPNAAMAVGWTAAHNVLISNAFMLAAVLLYLRAGFKGDQPRFSVRPAALCGAVVMWAAAMLARESAIALPALVVALDACFGGRATLLRRWRTYAVLAALALAYVGWRFFVFARGGMPAGYMSVPEGVEYIGWLLAKMVQALAILLLHLPLYTPMDYVEAWTWPLIVMQCIFVAVLAASMVVYEWPTRGARGRWFGPLWMLIGLGPVLPIQLMPHFAYLPFVGYALATPLYLSRIGPRRRRGLVIATLLLVGGMLAFQRMIDRAQVRAEQLVFADVFQSPPPAEGSRLFFINLPLPASFVVYAAREAWQRDDLTGYALTPADSTHRMSRATRIERTSERAFELACEPPGWFGAHLDRWFLKLTGRRKPFVAGETIRGECFDTTVLEAGESGVTRLRFEFRERLERADWLFFMATPERPMLRVRFTAGGIELDPPDATRAFRARYARWLTERDLPLMIRQKVRSWFGAGPRPSAGGR